MAYDKQTWTNDDPQTPLSADRLDHIETGIEGAHDAVDGIDLSGYATTSALNSGLAGKADDDHGHAFSDITGTATAGQIPTLAISKISGLQAALDALSDRLDALEGEGE